MNKIYFPAGYFAYQSCNGELFIADHINHKLIWTEWVRKAFNNNFYPYIPEIIEADCFIVKYNKNTDYYIADFDQKVKVKISVLEPLILDKTF